MYSHVFRPFPAFVKRGTGRAAKNVAYARVLPYLISMVLCFHAQC